MMFPMFVKSQGMGKLSLMHPVMFDSIATIVSHFCLNVLYMVKILLLRTLTSIVWVAMCESIQDVNC